MFHSKGATHKVNKTVVDGVASKENNMMSSNGRHHDAHPSMKSRNYNQMNKTYYHATQNSAYPLQQMLNKTEDVQESNDRIDTMPQQPRFNQQAIVDLT